MKSQQLILQSEKGSPFWEIKILLVETNCPVIRLVEKVFENSEGSYFLRRIKNLPDLSFELKYNKPDIVISGRSMDGFKGLDVLNQVQLLSPEIPVLMLVTDFNAKANIELVNHGAYDIVYHSELNRLVKEVNFLFKSKLSMQA